MSEFLSQPSPEQLILGGLLAIIIDYNLDFVPGELEDADIESDMIDNIVSALNEKDVDVGHILVDYGVLDEGSEL